MSTSVRLLVPVVLVPVLAACGSESPATQTSAPALATSSNEASSATSASSTTSTLPHFSVTSPDLQDGVTVPTAQVFNSGGCTGQNISPQLAWSGAPATTKGYALTIYDPDAPTGSGFWHWVVYDIPATTTSLPRGTGALGSTLLPTGAREARNDYGIAAYGGPCPPAGDHPHHYILTVDALDVAPLGVPDNPTPAVVGFNVHYHVVGTATLTATYGR